MKKTNYKPKKSIFDFAFIVLGLIVVSILAFILSLMYDMMSILSFFFLSAVAILISFLSYHLFEEYYMLPFVCLAVAVTQQACKLIYLDHSAASIVNGLSILIVFAGSIVTSEYVIILGHGK